MLTIVVIKNKQVEYGQYIQYKIVLIDHSIIWSDNIHFKTAHIGYVVKKLKQLTDVNYNEYDLILMRKITEDKVVATYINNNEDRIIGFVNIDL